MMYRMILHKQETNFNCQVGWVEDSGSWWYSVRTQTFAPCKSI
jgi:hypothetical protein